MSKNIKTVPTRDYDEVVATVAMYVEGLRVGSATGIAERMILRNWSES